MFLEKGGGSCQMPTECAIHGKETLSRWWGVVVVVYSRVDNVTFDVPKFARFSYGDLAYASSFFNRASAVDHSHRPF